MDTFKDIKLLVFDLDGTLYQDEYFVETYLTYLFKEDAAKWIQEAHRILNDQHAVKVGHFFNKEMKAGVCHRSGEVTGHYDWDGKDIKLAEDISAQNGMHYIGDAWGVIGAIADYMGIPDNDRSNAFNSVRRDMILGNNAIKSHGGLAAAIRGLTSIPYKILMSNSPEEAAVDFVPKLGLDNLFDTIIFGGNKPAGLTSFLKSFMDEKGIKPEQVLSIGDNAWNDLYPVKYMGGRTIWISPYESKDEQVWDMRLRTLDELENLLITLNNRKSTKLSHNGV